MQFNFEHFGIALAFLSLCTYTFGVFVYYRNWRGFNGSTYRSQSLVTGIVAVAIYYGLGNIGAVIAFSLLLVVAAIVDVLISAPSPTEKE